MPKSLRDNLKTDLGRLIYDFSGIEKESLPNEIREELAESFFKRHGIETYETHELGDEIYLYSAKQEPSLTLYEDWEWTFLKFRYDPPLIELEG